MKKVGSSPLGDVIEAHLEADGLCLDVLNYGATTRNFSVNGDGRARRLILGFQDPMAYLSDRHFIGAIAGRVANRIAGASFALAGQTFQLQANDGPNCLHGGPGGLAKRLWAMDRDSAGNAVRLTTTSPDGDGGFPGRAAFDLTISLADNRLTYDMRATVDRPTPISLAQHNYWNLTGAATIWDHRLTCVADRYVETGSDLLPTGATPPVTETRHDYRGAGRILGEADPDHMGSDLTLAFPQGRAVDDPVAVLHAPDGMALRFFSDQPGAQVYTATGLAPDAVGLDGHPMGAFAGLCFEPQGFPDAVNQPTFPSVIATPDHPYRQVFSIEVVRP